MPRFGTSGLFSPDVSSTFSPEESSRRPSPQQQPTTTTSPSPTAGSLSCLSPDGRSVYSLSLTKERTNGTATNAAAAIEAHHLPLEGTTDDEISDRDLPALIRIPLPTQVTAALAIDPPVELFCVDVDEAVSRPPDNLDEQGPPEPCLLPLLCLYTRHSIFHLQLAFSCPFQHEPTVVGHVVSCVQPLESHLVATSDSTRIVRVRPAPQRRMGYALYSPYGAMAVLTHDISLNEYALVLYHGGDNGNMITTPVTFGLEPLAEQDVIVDFSFGQTNGLSLLASMSVHFLYQSGAVWGVSPVLFQGAVALRAVVQETVDYLEYLQQHPSTISDSKWRQVRAARQFVQDAFGSPQTNSHHATARIAAGGNPRSATLWPVQIQGPLLVPTEPLPQEDDSYSHHHCNNALCLEPFFARDLVGLVVLCHNSATTTRLDFGVVPATAVLPRFAYETAQDQMELDDALRSQGVVVERVSVASPNTDEGAASSESKLVSLLRDPVSFNMIHCTSSRGVLSVSTNVMSVVSQKLRAQVEHSSGGLLSSPTASPPIRTTSWSSLDVGGEGVLQGAVISGDAHLGHTLVARLSNGSMEAINVTESRYLHESESIFAQVEQEKQEHPPPNQSAAHQAMEQMPPLYQVLEPLQTKVKSGLASMGNIVGGATKPQDVDAATLAMALAVKKRCDDEIVLPLKEMNKVTASRLQHAREMHKSQASQVETLKATARELKERMELSSRKLEAAQSNAATLAQRSGTLLQACQDMQPTLTDSEIEFYQLLKRVKAKCETYEANVAALQSRVASLTMPGKSAASTLELSPEEVETCHKLLKGQEKMLSRSTNTLRQSQIAITQAAGATGVTLDTAGEQPFGNGQ